MFAVKKIISLLVSSCVLISLFSDFTHSSIKKDSSVAAQADIFSEFNVIESSYKPDTPLIIFIQDLHTNPAVQKSIFNLLGKLHSSDTLDYIFAEGAPFGKIDSLGISTAKKKEIMNIFLLSGLVSGSEVFSVKNDFQNFYGIEDWDIYIRNLKIAALKYESDYNIFSRIKKEIYDNAENEICGIIKNIEKIKNLNGDMETVISEIGIISGNFFIDLKNYDEINKYLKINFINRNLNKKNAEKDIYHVMNFLQKNIPYGEYLQLTEKLTQSQGDIFLSDLYAILKGRFVKILADYPDLSEMLYLQELKHSLKPYELIEQTEMFKNNILGNIELSSGRKEYIKLYFFADILDKYRKLEISEDEFKYIIENKELILKTCFKYLIKEDFLTVSKVLSDAEIKEYYENNILRNGIFCENIRKVIDSNDPGRDIAFCGNAYKSVSVAVIGGFHGSLTSMLKNENISYISLLPATDNHEENIYRNLIRMSAATKAEALAPPLLSVGKGYELKNIVDFWSSFDDIYSVQAVNAVNKLLSERNIPLTVKIGKNKRLIIEPEKINISAKIKNIFRKIFLQNKRVKVIHDDKTRESVILNEYLRTLDSLNGAMPDIVLISLKNKEDIEFYENALQRMRLSTPLSKVNFKFIHASDDGTGASFIGIAEYLETLKKGVEFKNIKDKKFSELKICAVNVDGLDKSEVCRELPFHFNGTKITALELGILNGIRACRSFGAKGGLAMMDPSKIYIGEMKPRSEITIISSMVSYNDITGYGLPWIINNGGDPKVNIARKIYYNFELEQISNKLEKKGILEKTYNLDNRLAEQFETTTGNILFSFDDPSVYSSFWEQISLLYKNIYRNKDTAKTSPGIDFIQHILIPLLRMKNGEDSLSYFTKTGVDKDFGNFYEEYSSFFDVSQNENLHDVIKKITITSYNQPHSFYSFGYENELFAGLIKYYNSKINQTVSEDASLNSYDNGFADLMQSEYNGLIRVIVNTRFQKKEFDTERKKLVSLYKNIAEKSGENIDLINEFLQNNKVENINDRRYFENLKKLFAFVEYYSLEYLKTLDCFENISILGGYIYPKSSIFERLKIMPVNRRIFGIHSNFQKEKAKLKKQVFRLYTLGNAVSRSMYDYDSIMRDFNAYIDEKENPSEKTYLGIEKRWAERKAIQRVLSLILAFQYIVSTLVIAFTSVNGDLSLIGQTGATGAIIFSLCTGLGLSVFMHRFLIFLGKRNSFYGKKIKKLSLSEKNHFEDMYYMSDEDTLLREIKKELENLKKSLSGNSGSQTLRDKIRFAEASVRLYDGGNENTLYEIKKNIESVLDLINSEPEFKDFYPGLSEKCARIPFKDEIRIEWYDDVKKNITEASREYLEKWDSVLKSGDLTVNRLEIIRKYALQLIRITVFSESAFMPGNKEQIISIIQDFSLLYNATMDRVKTMPDSEKEKVLFEIRSFEETGRYARAYYKLLSYALNADILNSYRISENGPWFFLEKFKILTVVRYIMGINFGIYASQKGFLKSMRDLTMIGNSLVPGLYDRDSLMMFSENYLHSKRNPKRFDIGMNEFWKLRKVLARLFPLLFFATTVIANNLYLIPYKLFIVFITGIGIAIFMHWIPITFGLIHTKFHKITSAGNLNEEYPASLTEEIVKNKALRLFDVPGGKVPDIMFVSVNYDNDGINDIKDMVAEIMLNGNLKHVQIEFIINKNRGDGNALTDVFAYINSEDFKYKYPKLAKKDISEIDAVILNIDGLNHKNILNMIPFPSGGTSVTPLEISVLNAVGLFQNSIKKGSIIIADPSYIYIGDLKQTGDITLLSSDSGYEQIRSQNLPLFVSGKIGERQPGESLLRKIYKTFDIEKISNYILKTAFENLLKQKNGSSEQISAFSGLSSITMESGKMKEFTKYMLMLNDYIESYEGVKFKLDFLNHIMIPYTMLNNGDSIDVYLSKIISGISDREIRRQYYDFFSGIFEIHKNFYAGDNSALKVNIVRPPESLLSKAEPGSKYYDTITSFLTSLPENNAAGQKIKSAARHSAKASLKAVNYGTNNVSFSGRLSNMITGHNRGKEKTFIFLMPSMNPDYKGHVLAASKAGFNSVSAAIQNDIEDVSEAEENIIVNIPIGASVISAKVIISEEYKNSYVLKFVPLYSGAIGENEYRIINAILSDDYEDTSDALIKKIFLGRGMLAVLKDAASGRKELKQLQKILGYSLGNGSMSMISIDGAGVFANPQILNDSFMNDEMLNGINFGSLYINKEISSDKTALSPQEHSFITLSDEASAFNVFENNFLDTGLISALFSDAAFILNFNRSITGDIDAEDYKLKKLDKNIFYSDPKAYINNLSDLTALASLKQRDAPKVKLQADNVVQKIIPSLTLNTVSDILQLERLLDPKIINTVIISNLYAETENGSVIGNVFNPMLADLRHEMTRIGYKDSSFLGLMLEEKADLKTWKKVSSRFYAAGILLSHLKTKHDEAIRFEEFKKTDFVSGAEKTFEYFAAMVLSGKKELSGDEISEIKSLNAGKWDEAVEQIKYMEYIVFNRFKEASVILESKGIKVIVKTNLMTLAESVDFGKGYFESRNNGESVIFPEFEINPASFSYDGRMSFLAKNMRTGGFLITNIDAYHGKERIAAHLQTKLQNGLDKKMVLIFEDDDNTKYPVKENVFVLAAKKGENVLYKSGINDSYGIRETLDLLKNSGAERINFPLSFFTDAGIKLESIRLGKKDLLKQAYANPSEYYMKGYNEFIKNSKLAAEAEKLIINDEENSIHKIKAKGALVFNALYSYIKTNGKDAEDFLTYISQNNTLFPIAKKYLENFGDESAVMRYINNLELKSNSVSEKDKRLYTMQLIGFMNGIINGKYNISGSDLTAKSYAFADSFAVKDNFLNYTPEKSEIMSLYGLYLGGRDKKSFASKLYKYFKNWNEISGAETDVTMLLWLVEQFGLFYGDLHAEERLSYAKKIIPYLNGILEHCKNNAIDSAEYEALYLNALQICAAVNKSAENSWHSSYIESEIKRMKELISKKYFETGDDKIQTPDLLLFFSLSSMLNSDDFGRYKKETVKKFKEHSLSGFGGLKSGKAYPYYLYYYLMLAPYSERKTLLENLSLHLEDNLTLPEYFVRKSGFTSGGNYRDSVSAAYFAMIFNAVDDTKIKIKIDAKRFEKPLIAAKSILIAA
ncbi:MAG: hypothetical protein FWG57_06350 [Endomicrobia bacterium]|nr:hypothetical protein [Endomicrobiia bacterium]